MAEIEYQVIAGVAEVMMNRPAVHNAFNAELIAELIAALQQAQSDREVRVVVLGGHGPSFSAGADLNWMRAMVQASEAENVADALRLAELMRVLAFLSKPTIAKVHGSAFGGGVGLVACCDLAIAVPEAKFGLTESKLGLAPAVISPYVIEAIGARQARPLFLSGELISAERAHTLGLLHELVRADQLDAAIAQACAKFLKAGPQAVLACKQLVDRVSARTLAQQQILDQANAELIAGLRVSAEGQEGLGAFLDKRTPNWING